MDLSKMREKKWLLIFLPIIVLLVYSEIFNLNIVLALEKINPSAILSFLGGYFAQIIIVSFRDKKIVDTDLKTAFKARFLGYAVGLIVPGWAGQELTRSIVYNRNGKALVEGFSLSVTEASFDVIAGCILFITLLPIRFYIIDVIYILVALGNIVGWSTGIAYLYSTAGKTVKIEVNLLKLLRMDKYYYILEKTKKSIKVALSISRALAYLGITILGYVIFSLGLFPLLPNVYLDLLVAMSYFVSTLIPIPGASGVSELALAIFLPPSLVFDIVTLQLFAYSLGFSLIREIDLNELKKELDKIKRDGELHQGPFS
ncbi:lysylphosphatidylglycerol synthase domain-containing protein [Candidatus Acidianus copahuensis]|nr:lysylphosphatidylglycerol synthase domain-containing protein [Candidatus Acidianus copahuensis]